jgi:molybdopterin-guanine dinucleotide biosynthesis protein A
MGQDKAQLHWQGQPLLQRVYQVAQACTPDVFVLTPWPERYRSLLPTAQFLTESPSGGGPLLALAQVWEQVNSDWLWLLACDLPCLDLVTLQNWVQTLTHLPPTTLARVPQHPNRTWEPLCGFYRRAAQTSLTQFLSQGGRSFQAWFQQFPPDPIAITPALTKMLTNCNTPDDLP